MFLWLPLIAVALSGCDGCDYDGYQPMTVALISGSPASALVSGGGCAIYTDIPHDGNPDQHGAALEHIGKSVYECLTGASAVTTAQMPGGAFYQETLWFRIGGGCPNGFYGCFDMDCRTINTDLSHIGAGCPAGMSAWGDACWTQFYTVIGHEVMHGWLGRFH